MRLKSLVLFLRMRNFNFALFLPKLIAHLIPTGFITESDVDKAFKDVVRLFSDKDIVEYDDTDIRKILDECSEKEDKVKRLRFMLLRYLQQQEVLVIRESGKIESLEGYLKLLEAMEEKLGADFGDKEVTVEEIDFDKDPSKYHDCLYKIKDETSDEILAGIYDGSPSSVSDFLDSLNRIQETDKTIMHEVGSFYGRRRGKEVIFFGEEQKIKLVQQLLGLQK